MADRLILCLTVKEEAGMRLGLEHSPEAHFLWIVIYFSVSFL
jgi:hypothetical protein